MKGSIWAELSWPTRLVLIGYLLFIFVLPMVVMGHG